MIERSFIVRSGVTQESLLGTIRGKVRGFPTNVFTELRSDVKNTIQFNWEKPNLNSQFLSHPPQNINLQILYKPSLVPKLGWNAVWNYRETLVK